MKQVAHGHIKFDIKEEKEGQYNCLLEMHVNNAHNLSNRVFAEGETYKAALHNAMKKLVEKLDD